MTMLTGNSWSGLAGRLRVIGAMGFMLAASTRPALAQEPPPRNCAALGALRLPETEISAASVSAGEFSFAPAPNGVTPPEYRMLPAFCRVILRIRPTAESDIGVEVWLPAAGWNGRFVAVGNGGFQSRIDYPGLARALAKGYAAAGSNAGHDTQDGAFAIHHPERLIDWGYRAVHEMTIKAKTIIAARYGRPARWSYWSACSTGGRQGANAAERYPDDFDGLAIGAPVNPMNRLQLGSIWNNLAVNRSADSFIPRETWTAIHNAVLADCDAADGIADGLINDPLRCHFDPASLACTAAPATDCLTPGQIGALTAIYRGARNPRTGEQIYPGWAPSFEGGMPGPTAGKVPQQDAIDTFRVLFDDPDWDYRKVDFDTVVAASDRRANATINAADPGKLAALFRHGGKMLLYQGWDDVGVSALGTLAYYQRVMAANGGEAATHDAIRLFLAPGMNHCEGGDGPNQFDKLDVISAWVERGLAPDRIDAAHYNSAGRVDRTRPLCPYPRLAIWNGAGSTNDAANFSCKAPPPDQGTAIDANQAGAAKS